jgi:ATP-dependent RNA helicase DDX27
MRVAELKVNKAQKMIENREEIMSRPKRGWFQTHAERMQEKGT